MSVNNFETIYYERKILFKMYLLSCGITKARLILTITLSLFYIGLFIQDLLIF